MQTKSTNKLSTLATLILIWIYLLPTTVLMLATTYLLWSGENPDGFFLSNAFISLSVILIPFVFSVMTLSLKILLKIQELTKEWAYIAIGLACMFFLLGSNLHLYYQYVQPLIELKQLKQTYFISFLVSSFVATLIFAPKFTATVAPFSLSTKTKFMHSLTCAIFPVTLTICAYFFFI